MEPSVNILQVTPFIINSKPTNAWCLSDDLMYTCKLSQDPGVTKPNAGGKILQERASACCWKSWLLLSLSVWPSRLDCLVGSSSSNRLALESLEAPALAELPLQCTLGHCICTSMQASALVSPVASNSRDPSTQRRSQEAIIFQLFFF